MNPSLMVTAFRTYLCRWKTLGYFWSEKSRSVDNVTAILSTKILSARDVCLQVSNRLEIHSEQNRDTGPF
jgi:hypothetical protein